MGQRLVQQDTLKHNLVACGTDEGPNHNLKIVLHIGRIQTTHKNTGKQIRHLIYKKNGKAFTHGGHL